jgi:hypothetical protein
MAILLFAFGFERVKKSQYTVLALQFENVEYSIGVSFTADEKEGFQLSSPASGGLK